MQSNHQKSQGSTPFRGGTKTWWENTISCNSNKFDAFL